jgi:O-methyltransferase involved in polyketide biosynthesis
LTETGYDPAKKTLFLWEGVTLYLSETEVRKIMRSVSAQAFKDSILLADIYAIRMLNIGKSAAGKYVVGYTGEEFGFRLALTEGWEDTLSEFIGSEPMDFGDVFLWAVIKGKDLSWWLPKLPTKGSLACC